MILFITQCLANKCQNTKASKKCFMCVFFFFRLGWFITLSALLIAVDKELIELRIHISAGIPGAHVIAGAGSLQELLGLDRPR